MKQTMWKVPFRQVYCDTFGAWLRAVLWCFVVLKVFPHVADFGSSALLEEYIDSPKTFHEQYLWLLLEARKERRKQDPGVFVEADSMGYPVFRKKDGTLEHRAPVAYDTTLLRTGRGVPTDRVEADVELSPVEIESPLVQFLLEEPSAS